MLQSCSQKLLDRTGSLIIFLYKSKVTKHLCHSAVTLSIQLQLHVVAAVTTLLFVKEFLIFFFQTYETLAGL